MIITSGAPQGCPAAPDLALPPLDKAIRAERVLNVLTLLAAGEIHPEGVIIARDDAGVRGVQVCVPLAGASGLFWLPQSNPPDASLEDRLVQFALDWLRKRGTKI